ncbi:MAG TPA: hypothetical protein VFV96_14130 [Verrucomicrobiae bacterium]|nr:hypothetical protein [Verrucomicrobiae bacterium]
MSDLEPEAKEFCQATRSVRREKVKPRMNTDGHRRRAAWANQPPRRAGAEGQRQDGSRAGSTTFNRTVKFIEQAHEIQGPVHGGVIVVLAHGHQADLTLVRELTVTNGRPCIGQECFLKPQLELGRDGLVVGLPFPEADGFQFSLNLIKLSQEILVHACSSMEVYK